MKMEEFKNKNSTDNHIGVKDEIGKDMLLSQKESYMEDLDNYYEAVIQADKNYENYYDQWVIDKELMDLQLEHFGKDESQYTHKVHNLPRFWELEKQKFVYTIRQETAKADAYLAQQLEVREKALERIDIILKNLKEVNERLEE